MRILVVGGNSAVAQLLVPSLTKLGEVLTAGRSNSDFHVDFADSIDNFSIPGNVDVVVNLVAYFTESNGQDIFNAEHVNALGALKLAQASLDAGVKHFIHLSTMSVYLKSGEPYFGMYALSKRHADELLSYFCANFPMRLTIIRPSQIYGSHTYFRRHQPFIYTAIDNAKEGRDICIYGTHDAQRNYIYVDDMVEIISLVISKNIAGVYSCTFPYNVTLSSVAESAINAFGSDSRIFFQKNKADIPDNIFPYDDSLYRAIGFVPAISIEQGVAKIASEYQV